jgi:hypothetical protein
MQTGVEKGSVLDRDRLTQGWREWEHIKREGDRDRKKEDRVMEKEHLLRRGG